MASCSPRWWRKTGAPYGKSSQSRIAGSTFFPSASPNRLITPVTRSRRNGEIFSTTAGALRRTLLFPHGGRRDRLDGDIAR